MIKSSCHILSISTIDQLILVVDYKSLPLISIWGTKYSIITNCKYSDVMDNITLLFIKHLITISLPYVMKNRHFSVFKYSLPVFILRLFQRSSKNKKTVVDSPSTKERHHISKCFVPKTYKGLGVKGLSPKISQHVFRLKVYGHHLHIFHLVSHS